MKLQVGVLMDPIGKIKPYKDSTFAMLLAAQARGHVLHYYTQGDLSLRDGEAYGRGRALTVRDQRSDWATLGEPTWAPLAELDVLLLRKDPPVDTAFVHDTLIASRAEAAGVLVLNRPQALRDCNEKLYATQFPQCTPATVVARDPEVLKAFIAEHREVVAKVLDAMGGASIFRVTAGDPNVNVILETLTREGQDLALVQRYLPEIIHGDKRILLIDGEPVPYALARIPQGDEFRGNLARGGRAAGVALSTRDRWLCAQVAPDLKRRGLLFVGLDVIGDYITEINVTSPTCIRELDQQYGLDIAGDLFAAIEARCAAR